MNANRFFRSFKYAAEGVRSALVKEQNVRFHFLSAIIVVIAAFFTGLSYIEWVVVIGLIGGMIALEMVNSALERVVDLVTGEFHPLAKQAKDIAAGAVLVFALASAIIGLLIFMPKWF
ncbi:diacylglycerol kinase family protein [Planomicrobium sp. CPCC 101079]|uniref:diacylglycerol kinase family protein n=1 Tax=Planomicrobium sp. CPCC 101079 TaxID=2599618 RepID=UPI0011B5708D|nr:diacylglycerol kinase family protein [Planomicrobium sp. CPCC 101079]TWT09097.1 diacylglycerol kinase family protein [Planomicrobium sp. CPCC 101079]